MPSAYANTTPLGNEDAFCLTQQLLDNFAVQLNSKKSAMQQFQEMSSERIAECCDDADEKDALADNLLDSLELFTEDFDHPTVFLPTSATTGTVMDFTGDTIIVALHKMQSFYEDKFPGQDLIFLGFVKNAEGVLTLDLELHPSM